MSARDIDLFVVAHLLHGSLVVLASSECVWARSDGVRRTDPFASLSGSKVVDIGSDLEAERILNTHRVAFGVFVFLLCLSCQTGLLTSCAL